MRARSLVRSRTFWLLVAVVVVAGTFAVVHGHKSPVPASSTTTTVQRGQVTAAVSAAGTIKSSDTRGLSFSVAGTVTEVDVHAGDLVTAGQVLARIDPTDAQATVDAAQARVNDAASTLSRAQQTAALPPCPSATPHPAPSSTSGRPSAGPSASPSPPASSTAPSAAPSGSTAQLVQLAAPSSAPTCAPQKTNTSTTDAQLSAEQALNNAQLALTQAQAKLAGTVITAPIDGRVLSVGGAIGARENPGGTGFVVLGQVSTLGVAAQFTEADVGRLAVGQVAAITLPDRLDPVSGKVSQIDPAGTTSGRLVRYGVIIVFDTVPADLLLGESVTALVTIDARADVLYVASAAVQATSPGSGTVIVRAAGHDTTRTVGIGLRGDQYTEITSGLTEGEQVVLPSNG